MTSRRAWVLLTGHTRSTLSVTQRSSNQWMAKHCRDPWVIKAAQEGMRARSGFKIIQIQERLNLIKRNQNILELGAAPGAWTQQIVKWKSPESTLIAVDLLGFKPVKGAVCLPVCDFTSARNAKLILDEIQKLKQLHGVISDACPNLSGQHDMDYFKIADMIYCIWKTFLEDYISKSDNTIEYFLFKCFHDNQSSFAIEKKRSQY